MNKINSGGNNNNDDGDNTNNDHSTTANTNGAIVGIAYDIIYATTCNQVALVTKYAKRHGLGVFVSLSDLTSIPDKLSDLLSQASNNLDVVDTISIGNEYVNDGGSVSTVLSALGVARSILSATAYRGHVVTTDTFDQLNTNPDLCGHSDYCAANCHAYFTSTVSSSQAGSYVAQMARTVKAQNGNKRVVITESGWPSHGATNGNAVASPEDQKTALASIQAAFPDGDLIFFEAFDATYKEPGPFGVEQYFGAYDDN